MDNSYKEIENLIKQIKKSDKIVISGHISPDADAISSSLSLAKAIKKLGKSPIVLLGEYPNTYSYFDGHDMVKKNYDGIADLFISMDCGDIERLGNAKKNFMGANMSANIDHHISNNMFGDINIVNPKASSTSEIVYEIITIMGGIDIDIATSIYTGIVADTGGFKHNTTGQRTHVISGELIAIGVNSSMIHTALLYTHTLGNARLLAQTIQNIEIDGDIAISTLSKDEVLNKCGAKYIELEGISSYILDFAGINVGVILHEKQDGMIKASFRAKTLDVNNIAQMFGGGGHMLASGATLDMTLIQAKNEILERIKQAKR